MAIELWEYMTATRVDSTWEIASVSTTVPSDPGPDTIDLLTAAGRDGWQLVSTHTDDGRPVHVFKRDGGPQQEAIDIHDVGDA